MIDMFLHDMFGSVLLVGIIIIVFLYIFSIAAIWKILKRNWKKDSGGSMSDITPKPSEMYYYLKLYELVLIFILFLWAPVSWCIFKFLQFCEAYQARGYVFRIKLY